MAPTQSSKKIIVNRQVTVVDLGLVSGGTGKVDVDCPVVGQASGRQPQSLPSSLHYVLRFRGGGSTATSLSGDDDDDEGAASGDSTCPLADEAAGSGIRGNQRLLHDDGGTAVGSSSAGVPAREEGRLSNDGIGHAYPIFDEERRPQPRVEFVYFPFVVSPHPDSPRFESVLNLVPPVDSKNTSSASGASSSSQGGNQDQSRVVVAGCRGNCDEPVVDDRARNAPSNKGRDAGDSEEELTHQEWHARWKNKWKEHFDRLNQLRSQVQSSSSSSSSVPVARRLSFTPPPVSSKGRPDGTSVELRMIDGRRLSPEPVSQDW